MSGRGFIPIDIDGDPVVERRETRVVASLSKPSPLHATPQTRTSASIAGNMQRILDTAGDADDADDDVSFLQRLTASPDQRQLEAPKFPLLREADLARFQTATIRHPVVATLEAWRDPQSLAENAVWRELWWAGAGHRRVICSIENVTPVAGTEEALPSRTEQLVRMQVDVKIVTCEIEAQGLATAKVLKVVAPAVRKPNNNKSAGEDEDHAAVAAEPEAASPAAGAAGPSGVYVQLKNGSAAGFGARESAESTKLSQRVFIRSDGSTVANLKPGNVVLVSIELASALLHAGGAPRVTCGSWTISAGGAPAAGPVDEDDMTLDQVAASSSPNGAAPAAAAAAKRKKKSAGARRAADIVLSFMLNPDSKEAQLELRREEMKRQAKLKAQAGSGRRR